MLRLTLLCVVAVAVNSALAESRTVPQVRYKQALDEVQNVGTEVRTYLVNKKPGVLDPKRYYVLVLRVLHLAANRLLDAKPGVLPRDLYVETVNVDLPRVLLDPLKASKEVEKELDLVKKVLQPLVDVVRKVCANLQDDEECNRAVDAQVVKNPNLQPAVYVLKEAYVVSQHYLNLHENLLLEVQRLGGVGYALRNVNVLTNLSVDVKNLLKELRSYNKDRNGRW